MDPVRYEEEEDYDKKYEGEKESDSSSDSDYDLGGDLDDVLEEKKEKKKGREDPDLNFGENESEIMNFMQKQTSPEQEVDIFADYKNENEWKQVPEENKEEVLPIDKFADLFSNVPARQEEKKPERDSYSQFQNFYTNAQKPTTEQTQPQQNPYYTSAPQGVPPSFSNYQNNFLS